jgi:hypothetical protein
LKRPPAAAILLSAIAFVAAACVAQHVPRPTKTLAVEAAVTPSLIQAPVIEAGIEPATNVATPRPTRSPEIETAAELAASAGPPSSGQSGSTTPGVRSARCGLPIAAFCETFDHPTTGSERAGQLDPIVWGVSRATGNTSPGGLNDAWSRTLIDACAGQQQAGPGTDVLVCNGQLVEATNDNYTVTTLALYPRQPFDFDGRTGKVVFDVSNDTQGSHAAWPEFWITDKPVPAPFAHESTWISLPENGIGVRLGAACGPGAGGQCGTNCSANNLSPVWTVDSAIVIRNYSGDDSFSGGQLQVQALDCVKASSGPGDMNHVELDVSQSQIDVYATDSGSSTPLKHIALIPNANLTLTRGLIWLEDAHYNGDKFSTQRVHTFTWANVGFDGPVLPRDLGFEANDNLGMNSDGTLNLGWQVPADKSQAVNISGVYGLPCAAAALLEFLHYEGTAPVTLTYSTNDGPTYKQGWAYPEDTSYTWRTIAVPIPVSELRSGTNTVHIGANKAIVISNVDLILVGAGQCA